jgi:hypothetical protein
MPQARRKHAADRMFYRTLIDNVDLRGLGKEYTHVALCLWSTSFWLDRPS